MSCEFHCPVKVLLLPPSLGPQPIASVPICSRVLPPLPLRPFLEAKAKGKTYLPEIHVPLNMHGYNFYPHLYTDHEENKTKQNNNSSKLLQHKLSDRFLHLAPKAGCTLPRICWDAETDDATHRPKGFPGNMEEGIKLPKFLMNLHYP